MLTIYHNPRCSKSRAALAELEKYAAARAHPIDVINYLQSPPTLDDLRGLQTRLGCPVRDMLRSNEEEYARLGLDDADDGALLNAIALHPRLLQRPIVVYRGEALIARQPNSLRDFLDRV